jgi:chromosome segregation ATPase
MSIASQSTTSTDRMLSTSQENSMLMEALQITREETRQTNSKVDMLEGMVQTLQWKHMVMEKKLASSQLENTGSGNTKIDSMTEKIKGLIRDCDQFELLSNTMSCSQDREHQQIEALVSGVDQQILENKNLRTEFAKFKEKMVAFEDEMKSDRKQRQSWADCNWL